ncbi:MAG: ABC transporter transmembrane domain-containing protein [Rhodospirillales bacterium]
MLLLTSPKLAGLIVLVVPAVVVPLLVFGRRERKLSRIAQDRVGDLGAYAEETLAALTTVQAFTHEPIDRSRYADRVEQSVRAAVRRIRTRSALILAIILLGFGAITFSIWVGGRDVIAGRMTGGDLAAFIFYAVLLASSGATLSELWGEVAARRRRRGTSRRAVQHPPQDRRSRLTRSPAAPPARRNRIRQRHVHLPLAPRNPRPQRFSARIEPGETVALVGPSGAGKTTIFQLLLAFLRCTARHHPASTASTSAPRTPPRCAPASRWFRRTQ